MATRKMTFTLPEDLAEQFVRRVPARERSKYLANALNEKLSARDRHLVEACRSQTTIRRFEPLKKSSTPSPRKPPNRGPLPRRGEIWWVRLDPTFGAKIRRTRPCLVLKRGCARSWNYDCGSQKFLTWNTSLAESGRPEPRPSAI